VTEPKQMHWFVGMSMPKGDYTAVVEPRWIESHIIVVSLPAARGAVTFVAGTPKEIGELVADRARLLGSPQGTLAEELWPPDTPEGGYAVTEAA
jgi:hypothetical protein